MKKIFGFFLTVLFLTMFAISGFAAQVLLYPKFHADDDNGAPLSGGFVYTYKNGTTTDKATYKSATLAVAHENPIVLDTRGEERIYFSGIYTIVLTDSDGVQTWTLDNVEGQGSTIIDFHQLSEYADLATAVTAIGATKTTLYIDADDTMGANVTIPATLDIIGMNGHSITTTGFTFTSNGRLVASPGLFAGTGAVVINGSFETGLYEIFNSTITVTFGSGAVKDIYPEWWGADGAGDDEIPMQLCVNAAPANSTIIFNDDYTISDSLTITNKTDLVISGGGSITLSGAGNTDYIFELSGTIDNLTIEDLELIGENNAAYLQTAVGNASGQTISNVTFRNLKVSNINVGISVNAYLSGTYNNAIISGNKINNIVGAAAGSGYGIHSAGATNVTISNNIINKCQRHSIYQGSTPSTAGVVGGIVIEGNVISNHRDVAHDLTYKSAVAIARSRGVLFKGNIIYDSYDCALSIEPVTTDTRNCEDISIIGNSFLWPKNNMALIMVGEQAVPTSYFSKGVLIADNYFAVDFGDSQAATIKILNGKNITVKNNKHFAKDITTTFHFIDAGHATFLDAAAHLDYLEIANNTFIAEGTDLTNVSGVYIDTELCTTEGAHIAVLNNFSMMIPVGHVAYGPVVITNTQLIRNQLPNLPLVRAYTDGDLTPGVEGIGFMHIANAGAKNLTNFDNGMDGQLLVLLFADGNTTLVHDNTKIQLAGDVNFVSSADDTITLLCYNSIWYETDRQLH